MSPVCCHFAPLQNGMMYVEGSTVQYMHMRVRGRARENERIIGWQCSALSGRSITPQRVGAGDSAMVQSVVMVHQGLCLVRNALHWCRATWDEGLPTLVACHCCLRALHACMMPEVLRVSMRRQRWL